MRFQNNFPQYFYLSYGGQFSERRNWRNRSVFHMSLKIFLSHNVIACPWLATGRWFSPDTPVSPTNKTDHHDIAEILLKVALNTINQPTYHIMLYGVQIASGWRWTRRQIVAVTSFPYGQYNTIIIRSRPRRVCFEFKRRIFFS